MSEIPITSANFSIPIYPRQINQFRGAIVEMAMKLKDKFSEKDISTELFHNHYEETRFEKTINRYPLIQYQVSNKVATITAIGEAVPALQLLLDYRSPYLEFNNTKYAFKLGSKEEFNWEPVLLENPVGYRMFKWLALNPQNHEKYQSLDSLQERARLLDNCIHGHVLLFLKALGVEGLEAQSWIRSIGKEEWPNIYNKSYHAFDVTFMCNINLPELIGLGQAVSHGFGKIRLLNKRKEEDR